MRLHVLAKTSKRAPQKTPSGSSTPLRRARSTKTVMAGKASAPMMRFLQLRFVALVRDLELNLQVGHEYGPFNPICDAGSRGKR